MQQRDHRPAASSNRDSSPVRRRQSCGAAAPSTGGRMTRARRDQRDDGTGHNDNERPPQTLRIIIGAQGTSHCRKHQMSTVSVETQEFLLSVIPLLHVRPRRLHTLWFPCAGAAARVAAVEVPFRLASLCRPTRAPAPSPPRIPSIRRFWQSLQPSSGSLNASFFRVPLLRAHSRPSLRFAAGAHPRLTTLMFRPAPRAAQPTRRWNHATRPLSQPAGAKVATRTQVRSVARA